MMLDKQRILDALEKEREVLFERGQYGAEHILVHHAIRIIEDMTEEEQSIPFERLANPNKEAIEKRDAFMNRMEKEVTGVELQPDGTWTATYTHT